MYDIYVNKIKKVIKYINLTNDSYIIKKKLLYSPPFVQFVG